MTKPLFYSNPISHIRAYWNEWKMSTFFDKRDLKLPFQNYESLSGYFSFLAFIKILWKVWILSTGFLLHLIMTTKWFHKMLQALNFHITVMLPIKIKMAWELIKSMIQKTSCQNIDQSYLLFLILRIFDFIMLKLLRVGVPNAQ